MKKPVRTALVAALITVLGHFPLVAQEAAANDSMAEIAAALTRIAAVMEKQPEGNRLDLLMRRQDYSQRRVDRVENQLISANRELGSLRQNFARSEMELMRFRDADLAELQGWDQGAMEAQIATMEFDLDSVRRRIAELETKIDRLEQEKTVRQRELEDWQSFMDREISGLQ